MGLNLKKILRPIGKIAGALLPVFAPAIAAPISALSTAFARPVQPMGFQMAQFDPWGGAIGAGVSNLNLAAIAGPRAPMRAGVQPAGAATVLIAGGLTAAVVSAISKLARIAGVALTQSNIGRQGRKLWISATAFARRHPGVSVITFLTSLGLSIQEAGEFLAWGQATRRRARRRGISWADIRRTRRVIRVMRAMEANLAGLARRRVGSRGRAAGGTIIAQN